MSTTETPANSGDIPLKPVTAAPSPRAAAPRLVEKFPLLPRPWTLPPEPRWGRYIAAALLLAILVLYSFVMHAYYAGAHGGVDQSGYLRTAQLLVDTHRLSFIPVDPYQFASRMCIMTEPFRDLTPEEVQAGAAPYHIYAKYPFGFPLLAAVARWASGSFAAMYMVNPASTVLALAFAYLMFRQLLTRFTSLIGVLLLACNPLTLYYSNDANSHATTLLFICIGFWGLLAWMRTHSKWQGFVGGFALGYACTIRYSEFLLVLPVASAAAASFFANFWSWFKNRRTGGGGMKLAPMTNWLYPVLGWAIPIATLCIICWISFGQPWKTGYTYCHEDTGFGWKYFLGASGSGGGVDTAKQGNWETFLLQLNRTGLYVLWPLALVGLFGMVAKLPRVAMVLLLWLLPPTFLYMFYYWAPNGAETMVNYLRFFISIVPGLILAGLWLAEHALTHLSLPAAPDAAEDAQPNHLASLVAVTAFALAFLLVAAWVSFDNAEKYVAEQYFFVDFFTTTGSALWQFWHTGLGLLVTALVAVVVAGSWCFERRTAAYKTGLALGLAVAAMLACGFNLYSITAQLESTHARWVQFRQMIDIVSTLPNGTAVFADEEACNQLDVLGNYRLYSAALFTPGGFSRFERVVSQRTTLTAKDPAAEPEPDPYQFQRAKYYMELLGTKFGGTDTWRAKNPDELRKAQFDLWDKAFAENRRVAYLSRDDAGGNLRRDAAVAVPFRPGYTIKKLTQWHGITPPPPPAAPITTGGGRPFTGVGRRPPIVEARPTLWTLYEIIPPAPKKPVEPPTPIAPPAATTTPAPAKLPATTRPPKTIFDF